MNVFVCLVPIDPTWFFASDVSSHCIYKIRDIFSIRIQVNLSITLTFYKCELEMPSDEVLKFRKFEEKQIVWYRGQDKTSNSHSSHSVPNNFG